MNHNLKLSGWIYRCEVCGLEIDGDLNALIDMRRMGVIKVGKGIHECLPAEILLAGYMKYEGISHVSLTMKPPQSFSEEWRSDNNIGKDFKLTLNT
jgi:hypothetical protein